MSLEERFTVIIAIVFIGAMIVSLIPQKTTADVEPSSVETTATADVEPSSVETILVNNTEEAKSGYFVEDGSVRQYEDNDIYWEWQINDLSENAEIVEINSLMQYIAVQDGCRVWLINGHDDAQLIAEYGEVFVYPFYDGSAVGYTKVVDGVLSFERLYPFDADGSNEPVELTSDVDEIIGYRGFLRDGEYWYLDGNIQDWDGVLAIPAIKLGSNSIIRRDLERLHDNEMTMSDFAKKYDIH